MKDRPKLRRADAGFVCDVGESAVAVIVVEEVLAVLCHIEVGKAVVVVVTPDAAKTVGVARHSGLLGDVGKGPVAIVVVEGVAHGDTAMI